MIIVDWSDLYPDRSQQLLRAALIVKGRALTVYEEVHPIANAQSPLVHREFIMHLQQILPAKCHPISVTDAGFRSPWFALLNQFGYAWIGRIRNRDMMSQDKQNWRGCIELYSEAKNVAQDLGQFHYVRSKSVACQLVIIKKKPRGRHLTTVRGKVRTNSRSKKQAKGQTEPWLLAVSPKLKELTAKAIVAIYSGRMQIEQTFRDIKNPRWGLGLSHSQTRKADRLANLLLIGALACYALWLIALTVKSTGYRIEFGSKKKAAQALSLISLARWWLSEKMTITLSR